MNIHEAAKSGKPFSNPDMIGAWMIVNGMMVYRDNVKDFEDMDFIYTFCLPDDNVVYRNGGLYWMEVNDLLRDDWEVI